MREGTKIPLHKRLLRGAVGKLLLVVICLLCGTAAAQAAVDDEVLYVFNTFSFMVWGAMVMWIEGVPFTWTVY